jgi:hypothetical protein
MSIRRVNGDCGPKSHLCPRCRSLALNVFRKMN